jgi:hypothetical protein
MAKPYAHLAADHLAAYASNAQVHDTFLARPLRLRKLPVALLKRYRENCREARDAHSTKRISDFVFSSVHFSASLK